MTSPPDVTPFPLPGSPAGAEAPPAPPRRRAPRTGIRLVVGLALSLLATSVWFGLPGTSWGAGLLGPAAPSRLPPDASPAPLATPAPAPLGEGGHAFMASLPDGSPVTFDPCRPLHFVVRPDGAPPGADALLAAALGEVSRATGLVFVADGATDEAPSLERAPYQPERYGDRWAPVLVAWSREGAGADGEFLGPGVLGRAGPAGPSVRSADDARWVTGQAVFHGPAIGGMLATGREDYARAVLLHELAHLVGLGHVDDPYQVMYGAGYAPLTSFRDGDLRGLERLGSGRCRAEP